MGLSVIQREAIGASLEAIAQAARDIRETELRQAARVQTGTSLRSQLRFLEFLERPATTQRSLFGTIWGRKLLRIWFSAESEKDVSGDCCVGLAVFRSHSQTLA